MAVVVNDSGLCGGSSLHHFYRLDRLSRASPGAATQTQQVTAAAAHIGDMSMVAPSERGG